MLPRLIVMAAGLTGAVGLSQFPEYAQQYTQRLAGAVDELTAIAEGFDADAQSFGLSREEALAEMQNQGGMAAVRAETMHTVFDRQARLEDALAALKETSALERAQQVWHMTDIDVARKAWEDFRPAMPATTEGAVFAGSGFLAGWIAAVLILGLLRMMISRSDPPPYPRPYA